MSHENKQAGKGDRPRNNASRAFRNNYDQINWDNKTSIIHDKCRFCGHEESYFSRIEPIGDFCSKCGKPWFECVEYD